MLWFIHFKTQPHNLVILQLCCCYTPTSCLFWMGTCVGTVSLSQRQALVMNNHLPFLVTFSSVLYGRYCHCSRCLLSATQLWLCAWFDRDDCNCAWIDIDSQQCLHLCWFDNGFWQWLYLGLICASYVLGNVMLSKSYDICAKQWLSLCIVWHWHPTMALFVLGSTLASNIASICAWFNIGSQQCLCLCLVWHWHKTMPLFVLGLTLAPNNASICAWF